MNVYISFLHENTRTIEGIVGIVVIVLILGIVGVRKDPYN